MHAQDMCTSIICYMFNKDILHELGERWLGDDGEPCKQRTAEHTMTNRLP